MALPSSPRRVLAVLALVPVLVLLAGSLGLGLPQEPQPQDVVIHLKHFTDDLHCVFMAVKLGAAMQQEGHQVTLFTDIEGARLADARSSHDLGWGGSGPLSKHYKAFVEAGGRVLVCPHCAAAASLDAKHLREGARIGTEAEVVRVLLDAEKILDY